MPDTSPTKYDFFSDELMLNMLSRKNIGLKELKKFIKQMRQEISEKTVFTSDVSVEEFASFEKKHFADSVDKTKLKPDVFMNLPMQVNPYILFTKTYLSEEGVTDHEHASFDIALVPKYIALGSVKYIPLYLNGDYAVLKNLQSLFSGQELLTHSDNDENTCSNLLKKFLIEQIIISTQ